MTSSFNFTLNRVNILTNFLQLYPTPLLGGTVEMVSLRHEFLFITKNIHDQPCRFSVIPMNFLLRAAENRAEVCSVEGSLSALSCAVDKWITLA